MNPCIRVAIAAALALPAFAQAPAAPNAASKDLHAAWLREVLDLDVGGAVTDYQKIAYDQRPAHIERWIAVARLAELERAGVRVQPRPSFVDAPAAIRPAFAALTPIPVPELLRRASGDPEGVLQAAGTDTGRVPAMRPTTGLVQQWVREQTGPSPSDRTRARERAQSAANRARADARNPEPSNAAYILRVELEGRQERAAALRSLYFPDWKAPAATGDPAATLVRVRANLDAWAADTTLPQSQQRGLRTLREAIDRRATTDPAAAVAFVARLPVYAERLLAAPPANR